MERAGKMLATLAISLTLLFLSPISSEAKELPLYVFGDSLFDTGTALYIDKGPAARAFPYGETYFNGPAGRFSDGRLIPDFIAQYANLPFPVPYSNPNFDDYEQAVNFADAAAGVLVETRPNTLNLKLQTENYLEMVQKMQQKYGAIKTRKLLSRALYLFNIGGNDYVDLYNFNPRPLSPSMKNTFMNQVLGNFTTHIISMYNQGARKFAFQNMAPIGCLPAFLQPDGTCSEDLNDLCKMHNAAFKKTAKRWTRQLPGFKYSIYDFYNSLSARLNNGPSYGFVESKSACCGSGLFNGQFTCMDGVNFTVCSNPNEYLWFDAGHPTEKADQQFAQEFWSGSTHVVVPRNIKSLFGHQY